MLRSLDLFSGIGGITLALEGLAKPVAYCDWSDPARVALKTNMDAGKLPRAPVSPDVRELGVDWLKDNRAPTPDIIVGGFPCVGFSALGNLKGFEERQSGLFSEILRLADETQAPLLFLENVPNVLKMGMHDVSFELTIKRGYELRWVVVRAETVGAPHARPRWYCLAVKPHYKHRWSQPTSYDPFPWTTGRMPARGAPVSNSVNRNSMALLGNSVVPDAVRYAFLYLLGACSAPPVSLSTPAGFVLTPAKVAASSSNSLRGRKHIITEWPRCGVLHVGERTPRICAALPPMRPPPALSLTFDSALFKSSKPPSAMLSSPLVKAPVRAVKWSTPRHGCTGASNYLTERSLRDLPTQVRFEASTLARHRGGGVNPVFVEWLMGYPPGWTLPKGGT